MPVKQSFSLQWKSLYIIPSRNSTLDSWRRERCFVHRLPQFGSCPLGVTLRNHYTAHAVVISFTAYLCGCGDHQYDCNITYAHFTGYTLIKHVYVSHTNVSTRFVIVLSLETARQSLICQRKLGFYLFKCFMR